jgi:hypothetical protein
MTLTDYSALKPFLEWLEIITMVVSAGLYYLSRFLPTAVSMMGRAITAIYDLSAV